MGLLDGKRLLITGVLTKDSIAFAVAQRAEEQGAELVLTGAGRGLSMTERMAKRLASAPTVLEFDVTQPDHASKVREWLETDERPLHGALHSIGFAPPSCLGGDMMGATWDDVGVAMQISAYSLKTLAEAVVPVMTEGASIVGLDFDASVAWPAYNWMGVAKAALESTSRYLARDLGPKGIRVNLVAAGPIRTLAAKSIPDFALFEDTWAPRAPLGWDVHDPDPVARTCVALFSDWLPATTGEIVHVDGGYHITPVALSGRQQ
ncbi:MAG: enoyl-ACP reductase FabI [Acidimicrobiia bacterium]|nr:enoyl-ACP reductase FabI [Acidimicrobiia bacterium]